MFDPTSSGLTKFELPFRLPGSKVHIHRHPSASTIRTYDKIRISRSGSTKYLVTVKTLTLPSYPPIPNHCPPGPQLTVRTPNPGSGPTKEGDEVLKEDKSGPKGEYTCIAYYRRVSICREVCTACDTHIEAIVPYR
jgi:hypothetical protein